MSTATELSDATLVQAAREGREQAIRQLLDRHLPSVTAVCRQRLRSASDVEDATQETAERAIRELGSLRDPDAVGAWMRGIAVRVCRESIRTSVRGPVCLPSSHLPDGPSLADDVEQHLLRAAEAEDLHEQLATLNDRDRLALWWRDALGMPVSDVADELGVTRGSARVLLSRARGRLRDSLKGVAGALGGFRLSLREFMDRFTRDAPSVDWTAVAQGAAAVVAATVVALPGMADRPAGAGQADQPAQRVTYEDASAAVTDAADDASPAPTSAYVPPRAPASGSDPQPREAAAPAPDSRSFGGNVGPVHVTNEEPEDEPEVAAGVVDPEGDTIEGVVHAGNLPVPDVEEVVPDLSDRDEDGPVLDLP